jgi:hypothetical protein
LPFRGERDTAVIAATHPPELTQFFQVNVSQVRTHLLDQVQKPLGQLTGILNLDTVEVNLFNHIEIS